MGNQTTKLIKEITSSLRNGIEYSVQSDHKDNAICKLFKSLDRNKNDELTQQEMKEFLTKLFEFIWERTCPKRACPQLVSNGKVVFYIVQEFQPVATELVRQMAVHMIYRYLDWNDDAVVTRMEFIGGLQQLLKDVLIQPVVVAEENVEEEVEDNYFTQQAGFGYYGPTLQASEKQAQQYHQNLKLDQVDQAAVIEQPSVEIFNVPTKPLIFQESMIPTDKTTIPHELCILFRQSVPKPIKKETKDPSFYVENKYKEPKRYVLVEHDFYVMPIFNVPGTCNTWIRARAGEVFRLINDNGFYWNVKLDKFITMRKGFIPSSHLRLLPEDYVPGK